ncbi:MAG: galactokinase [Spirochaetes bacterium]|uniref:Galactokinase n=1 Tax=Candidatus Ornithospirochaeta stercoripullorum TaxID=2840899 RepID=A0A9D9H295_9SPIO|nr:galactokinase [Candidatus Ornithospirochaeta stercoripullorum]
MIEQLHKLYPALYGKEYDEKEMDNRFQHLVQKHKEIFGEDDPAIFSAAGRTEIGGNHTDHNLGKVIGGSVNLDTIGAVTKRSDNRVIIASEGFPVVDVDISDLSVKDGEKNGTDSLVRGIAAAYKDRGMKIGGWQANTTTKVLGGSGLSSSAAIEVLIAKIFDNLYNDDALEPIEIAKMGKYAENKYFGKPSGLLDQACCAQGGIVGIDFKDNDNPVLTPVNISFEDYGYTMIITDTRGSHADLTGEYAAVPPEMREVAAYYGKKNLRDVDFQAFIRDMKDIREKLGNDRALLRAYHFFTENIRVDYMLQTLKEGDIDGFLGFVNESGNSSFRFLQNVYPSSSPKNQGLALAIALSEHILQGDGAVRVHGGGFAGTIQAYVPQALVGKYISGMESLFGSGCSMKIAIRQLPVTRLI